MANFNILKTLFLRESAIDGTWSSTTYGTISNKDLVLGEIDNPDLSKCVDKIVVVNLSPLTDRDHLLKWLKENGKRICYKDSYEFIERLHLINTQKLNDERIDFAAVSKKMNIAQLLNEIQLPDFDSIDYESYIVVSFLEGVFHIEVTNDTDTIKDLTKASYSFPLFRSILYQNSVTKWDECFIKFAEVAIELDDKSIVNSVAFKVDFPNKTSAYYDYSHNPAAGVNSYSYEILKSNFLF